MAITLANILFIGLIAENALIVVGIIVYQLYKKMYAYDCGVYIERGNGAVTYHSTRGSKVNRGNVSFLNLFMFKNRDIPFPNNDAILIGNKGGRMEIFLDSNGSAHQIRKSRRVPIFVKDPKDNKLRQQVLDVELADGSKKKLFLKEVVFEPDTRSDRAWLYNTLRRIDLKFQTKLEEWKPILYAGIALICVTVVVIMGYYFLGKSYSSLSMACNQQAINVIGDKIGFLETVVGGIN